MPFPPILAQTTLVDICGEDPGAICEWVWNRTENELATNLAEWLGERPLRVSLILLATLVINRLVRRVIRHFVDEITDGEDHPMANQFRRVKELTPKALRSTNADASLRSTARAQTIGLVLKSTSSAAIWSLGVMMALGEVGVNLGPLIAGAGVVGVALGFGAQSLVKDFLSGLFMLAEDQYGVGDVVDVGEASGTIEAVNLRTTRLRDVEGTVWYVPNGEIRRVGNMSQQWARALIDFDVAYDTEVERAESIVLGAAQVMAGEDGWRNLILEPPEVWGVQNLGPDSVSIRLVVKTQPGEQWAVMRELRRRVKARFDAEGIEIPFPQRTLWVRRDEGSSVAASSDDDPFGDRREGESTSAE